MTELQSIWRATAEPTPPVTAIAGDCDADVVVIGGGIMGTTVALTLAKGGANVVLLEAQTIGEEASSRAGGFVVPHFTFGGPEEVVETFGALGERLIDLVGSAADRVFALARDHDMASDAKQGGWYQPAHGQAAWRRINAVAEQWAAHGIPVEVFDGAETERRTGARGYAGSWMMPRGGTIHPLNYTLGLAAAARQAGARIFERSPALAVTKSGDKFLVRTPGGTVRAERVVVCTNARSHGVAPAFDRSLVRMKIWQCATAPIPACARRHLFQHGESLSDTRANLFTYRFDRDWRLITGAVNAFGVSPARAAAGMSRSLQKVLGLSVRPSVDYLWTGTAAVTRSRLPQVAIAADGLVAVTACNGRGIAFSTVLGEALGTAILSDSMADVPAPLVRPAGGVDVVVQQLLSPFYPYYGAVSDWLAAAK